MNHRAQAVVLVALLLSVAGCADHAPALVAETEVLMGTRFEIRLVARDEAQGKAAIRAAFAEVARVEALLSEWRDDSEISELNRRAGRGPVTVGPELLDVVRRAAELSTATGGAFDITFAACGGLWSFDRPRIPEDSELDACLALVGYDRVQADVTRSTIELPHAGMRIGIAGIGKGYGIDRAAEVLEARGFHDYFVDGGGDIRIAGRNRERAWTVGIADPRQPGNLLGVVEPGDGAIVTSGDYQLYFERAGVRYHHILDPATGRPARRSIAVTVVAPTATEADALATGLFVLGAERGLAAVDERVGIEALIMGPDGVPRPSAGFPGFR